MPTTRKPRTSSGPAAKGSQKTLSFGNKVTKPSAPSSKDKARAINPKTIDVSHITSEAGVAEQARVEVERSQKERTVEEEKASQITDEQIRKYWREREAERKAPRVHQKDLSIEERVLRLFDMSSQFGPAMGIARMKRWIRANKLGLEPPIEVLAVLLKEEEKGNSKIERAYVDELMSSKFVIDEA